MASNHSIRTATTDDVPALTSLMNELGYPTTASEMKERFENIRGHSDYTTLVAEYDNRVAGMIGLLKSFYYEKNSSYIRIVALVVSREFRNRGIGKALMNKAEELAAQNGSTQLILTSGNREERKEAHTFYLQLGFEAKSTGFVKTVLHRNC